MPKKAMSVTLDETNVTWLRARARMTPGNNVSELLDTLITRARTGKAGALPAPRSAVGMVDLSDDPNLEKADAYLRELYDEWLANASLMNQAAPGYRTSRRKKTRG